MVGIEHLRSWIGRSEQRGDAITPGLIDRFRATFGKAAFDSADGVAPLGIHWCLALAAASPDALGHDGHQAKDGLLPPLPRRMWAGGEVEFLDRLSPDDKVVRRSRIVDVQAKTGRTGALVFVVVEHEIATQRGVAVRECQDIVYRNSSATTRPSRPVSGPVAIAADHSERVDADAVLLFRYSALTFNSHRIHYDRGYASAIEGYPGLVVQGPLQATLLLHLAARRAAAGAPGRFSYRSLAPLFDGSPFTLNLVERPGSMDLWTADSNGNRAMSATAFWQSVHRAGADE